VGEDARALLPPGTLVITLDARGVSVESGSLLYYPHEPSPPREPPAAVFADGERLEHAVGDNAGAERAYSALTAHADSAIRAGALGRLARVQRKRLDIDGAIATYDRLAEIGEPAGIDGFPATLYARLGRASALQQANRQQALEAEAHALWADLLDARWILSAFEYEARRQEIRTWLGADPEEHVDRAAIAQAAQWLWQNRQSLSAPGHRPLTLSSGPAVVAWTPAGDRVRAALAGPAHVSALLNDVRTEASSRRVALAAALGAVGLVLLAGWHFILRSLARERRAAGLQSDFVAAVSHEFRSPLTSMAHLAEMLEADRLPSAEARRTTYGILVRDTHRLRRLVEDLLDFRRLETGAAALRLEAVDLTDLVRTVAADFQARVAAPAGYRLDVSMLEEPICVPADRDALTRALWNLLDNAVKYSPGCRTVWLSLSRKAGQVAITVRDEGLGIPVHEHRRIFERFARGAKAGALRIKGTGIGLSIVLQIVRAHGGDVRVASEPGRGSRFTIFLRDAAETTS
jgi:signal transduction histidine kinase